MKRLLPTLLLIVSARQAALMADEMIQPVDPELGREVDFYQDVYPILQAKCLACHNAAVKEGDLVLETAESIAKGGFSGEAVTPGKPDESILYWLASREYEPFMPPLPNEMQAKPLTPRELGILRQWIEQGAKGGVRQIDSELHWQAIPESYPSVYSLALFPGERYLAAGRGNRIFIYDLVTGREAARLTDPALQALQQDGQPLYGPGVAHRDFVHSLAVHPDGDLLASGGYRVVKLWERQPPAQLAEFELPGAVRLTSLDAEGRHAAFVLETNEVRVWNLANGTAGAVIPPSDWNVAGAAFSPGGNSVITAGESGRVRLWGIDNGRFLAEMATAGPITALAVWSEEGQLLTAHADNVIRAWTLPEEAQPLPDKPALEFRGHDQPVTSLLILRGRGELVSAGRDRTVRIWNLQDGQQVVEHKADAAITALGVAADGERIIIADENQHALIVNRKGERVAEIKGNLQLARQVEHRTDELAVARQQFTAAESAVETAQEELQQREQELKDARSARDEAKQAISPAQDNFDAALEDVQQARAKLNENPDDEELKEANQKAEEAQAKEKLALEKAKAELESAERAVELAAEAVQTDKETLEERSAERETAETRRNKAEKALTRAQAEFDQSNRVIESLTATAGGQMILTAGQHQPVQLWKATTGAPVDTVTLPGTTPTSVRTTATGALLTVDDEGRAALWDLTPRWALAGVLGPDSPSGLDLSSSVFKDRVTALAFSPDGTLLATGGGEPSRTGELMLWDVQERQLLREIPDAHRDVVFSIDFSRDGRLLATGGADRFARLFHVDDGSLVREFEGHNDHVLGVALKADGSTLASASADKTIKLWDVETGEQQTSIENYDEQVTAIDFVGITDRLVSSSGDANVKFHRANDGDTLRTFRGSRDYVYAALATDDKGIVIAAGEDGVVRIWNAENGSLLQSFDPPRPTQETASSAN